MAFPAKTIIPVKSVTSTARFMLAALLPRYQTPFLPEIEEIDPLEKFKTPKFMLYDGKSNTRSHISHFRQMMALWNHHNAFMCKIFSSSLGDLRFKWFDKLPAGSIKSFYQFFEPFVARFVINTKALKDSSYLLTLHKGKNETLHNYSQWY